MSSRLKEQLTFVAIRRLMCAVLGNRKRGQLAGIDDTRVDPAQVLSGAGGFYTCFPDPMTWKQSYMRGMDDCPYVNAFWRACHDVGAEFSPVGVIGFDEELECYISTEETFQQLGMRFHFHWTYSNHPVSDKSQPMEGWVHDGRATPQSLSFVGGLPVLGNIILLVARHIQSKQPNHSFSL